MDEDDLMEKANETEDGKFDCWLRDMSKDDLIQFIGIDDLKQMWLEEKDD